MEMIIPALALGGLYFASKKDKEDKREQFYSRAKLAAHAAGLPNVDVPDRNYPNDSYMISNELDATSQLSTVNRLQGTGEAPQTVYRNGEPSTMVYTDKYFSLNPEINQVQNATAVNVAQQERSYTSMMGEQVNLDHFRHNNMAPYFGSKSRANNASNSLESTLDNYTGNGSQQFAKREVNSFFKPSEGYQWAHGMPTTSEFVQSRIVPSMNMAGVKPFDDIKVGPGVGIGYGNEGMGGYNSGMLAREQWMDKTVDQLRVANKQKASGLGMLGYEGPANSSIKRSTDQAHQGIVEKNRVERTFEMGSDRLFTTTGVEKGPAMRALQQQDRSTRPETSVGYAGIATLGNQTLQQVRGEYMPTHNQQLGAVPFSAPAAPNKGTAFEGEYGMKSTVAYPNNRSFPTSGTNSQPAGSNYFGTAAGAMGAVVAPLLDLLRPSRKENTIGNLRPYQNAKGPVEQMYVYDPSDRPSATMRDMTQHSSGNYNINANHLQKGAYTVSGYDEIRNQRDTTTVGYMGNVGGGDGNHQIRPYDAEYSISLSNGIKESTLDGRLVPGNMSLLNGNITMRTNVDRESLMRNERAVDGTRSSQIPSQQSFGILQGSDTKSMYQNIQLDRNSGDILSQLKKNPYTHSVVNGL
jgi:hypothetical protein